MKGTALATNDELWDVADYVVPPEVRQHVVSSRILLGVLLVESM